MREVGRNSELSTILLLIRWNLMVYEIPVSFVENLEVTVSKYISFWLGFPGWNRFGVCWGTRM